MIKRQYFISTQYNNGRTITYSYRQFGFRSLFAKPHEALEWQAKEISKTVGCDVANLTITSFNKC